MALAAPTAIFAPAAAQSAASSFIDVRLLASTMAPKPGSTVLVGFRMVPTRGWHGYWSNPGESGLAPTVHWTAPPGVRFGPLLHPAPTLLQSMGVVSYVHSGPHVLVSRMMVSRTIAAGTAIPVTADLHWAACSANQCVPQHATFSLQMIAGDGAPSPSAKALDQATAALPVDGPRGTFSTSHGKLLLRLPSQLRGDPRTVRFFPDRNGFYDAPEAHVVGNDPLVIESPLEGNPPDPVTGVLTAGSAAYRLTFDRAAVAVPAEPGPAAAHAEKRPVPAAHESPSDEPSEIQPAARRNSATMSSVGRALLLLGIMAFAIFAFALARRPYR